jgi:hypothetical protein
MAFAIRPSEPVQLFCSQMNLHAEKKILRSQQ